MKNKILCLLLLMSLGLTACNVGESGQGTIKTKKDAISKSYYEDIFIPDKADVNCPGKWTQILGITNTTNTFGTLEELYNAVLSACDFKVVAYKEDGNVLSFPCAQIIINPKDTYSYAEGIPSFECNSSSTVNDQPAFYFGSYIDQNIRSLTFRYSEEGDDKWPQLLSYTYQNPELDENNDVSGYTNYGTNDTTITVYYK